MKSLEKGTILENTYEIIEEIGSGGGGIVFKAKHLRLQTDVVVKKIKDEVRGKVESRKEADILKNLKHPYLPRVYDFIETEDGVYTVMDFVYGEDMKHALDRHGKFSQKQVSKWAEQLGEALDYLHSQKPPIIHSDIKPANIMLTEEGNVCLIDFNISLAMGGEMASAVGISAGFSPPEQYRDPALYAKITYNYTQQKSLQPVKRDKYGETDETECIEDDTELTECVLDDSDKTEWIESSTEQIKTAAVHCDNLSSKYERFIGKGIDERSDIYSLGITLYYMLTGIEVPPAFEQRIPLEETKVTISEGFAVILNKMMEFDPEMRYQNGKAFLKAVCSCYKLDHRYIIMHRKQTGIQFAALIFMVLGIVTVFGGLYKVRVDKNSSYYNLVKQAQEVMKIYDYKEADELLKEAKEISEMRIEAYEEEVYLLYLSEKYEDCIALGETYINTVPFLLESEADEELFGNIYYLIGNSYYEISDYSNAKSLFEYALEYNKRNALYYRDYAIVLAKMGQVDAAEKHIKEGISLGLAEDSIYMVQGEIANVKGQYKIAVDCLRKTIETTADMQMKKRAILLCADVYKTMGNSAVDDEIALLELYVSQFEGNGNLVMTEILAEAYARKAQVNTAQSEKCYEKALDLFLSIYDSGYITYQLQENIAILYENMQRFDDAETMLLNMSEIYPERYEVYKRLAFLEADRQQEKDNIDRDYVQMQIYYEKAKEKYSDKEQDAEMDMLDIMMQEIREGGWL